MTHEIKIYMDRAKRIEVTNSIDFGIVKAGENTDRSIFIENKLPFEIGYNLLLTGKDISLINKQGNIAAFETVEVKFKLTPKLDTMQPIKADLDFNGRYVIS